MPHASKPKNSPFWQITFLGFARPLEKREPGGQLKRRRQRLNLRDIKTKADAVRRAKAIEADLDFVARAVADRKAPDGEILEALVADRVLTPKEAAILAGTEQEDRKPKPGRATVQAAFAAHPSSIREQRRSPRDWKRYEGELQRYLDWPGSSSLLKDLTVDRVTRFVEYLAHDADRLARGRKKGVNGALEPPVVVGRGLSFSMRKHALKPLRRASAMAPAFNLPNYLAGWQLDKDDSPPRKPADTYEPEELVDLLLRLSDLDDARAAPCLGLMALCGLRPSEAMRLRVGDVVDDVLHIGRGEEGAKTETSARSIPLPAVLVDWLTPLIEGRKPGAPLFPSHSPVNAGGWLDFRNLKMVFPKWIKRAGGRYIAPKYLRKTFVDLTVWHLELPKRLVDAYLGRPVAGLTDITTTRYLGKAPVAKLRQVAESIDDLIRARRMSLHPSGRRR